MARYGRGLICLTLTRERCEQLRLPLMVSDTDVAAPHELHGLDRGRRRRHDRHLGARSRAHDPGGGRAATRDAERPASAGPHLSADGAARRRADARRAHGGRLRSRAARGPRARRRDRRDPERRRHDGAPARSGALRAAAQAEDRHDRRPDPLPTAQKERSVERIAERTDRHASSARSAWSATRITSTARCTSRSCAARSMPNAPPLVRVHLQDTLGDVSAFATATLRRPLRDAMQRIAEQGHGVIVLLRPEESAARPDGGRGALGLRQDSAGAAAATARWISARSASARRYCARSACAACACSALRGSMHALRASASRSWNIFRQRTRLGEARMDDSNG